jgi:hypothetical protein
MTQRKARAKSEPKTGKGSCPQRKPKNNYFSTLMSTPEGRELRRQWSTKKRKNPGRPKGVPDGYRKAEIEPIRDAAKERAAKAVKIMSEKYDIEDQYAQDALRTAVEVMQVPGETRERLAAARLVLDFTKSRPASKQEVTIGKAEEFLASLLDEDENGSEATTGSQASSD